jgi:DNA repair protein RadC
MITQHLKNLSYTEEHVIINPGGNLFSTSQDIIIHQQNTTNMQDHWTATELTIIYKPGYRCEKPLDSTVAAFMFIRSVWNPELFPLQSHCMAFFLNRKGRTIAYRPISTGSMSSITVDIKLIACLALQTLADSVITAISRPSGNMNPSEKDLALIKKLKDGLDLLEIKLLDHLIISNNNYLSLHDENLL